MSDAATRKAFKAWTQTGPRVLHLMLNSSLGPANGRVYWADETESAWLAWQAATRAAVPAWQPIETAPKDHFPRLFLFDGAVVQCFFDAAWNLTAQNNSEGRWGAHAGWTWRTGAMGLPLDIQAGAIAGYTRAPVLPLATASVLLAERHRLILIPGPSGLAINLAYEF